MCFVQVACLVATEILALVGLRSFRTAALLLLGLLAYDVFWVFGSPTGGVCLMQLFCHVTLCYVMLHCN